MDTTNDPIADVAEGAEICLAEAEGIEEPRACPWADPVPVFCNLDGAAGSGKTFLTRAWAAQEFGVELAATTGIAALNLGGQTINSLLSYFDTKDLQDKYVEGRLAGVLGRLWRTGIKRIILDEKSMLNADQLTCLVRAIEAVNGNEYVLDARWVDEETPPSLGLTLVGDFAQLAPVKEPYAFESPEWHRFQENTITLTEIRRQADPEFIEALRAARVGDGKRAAEFFASRMHLTIDDTFQGPTLFATNAAVDRYNQLRMDRLPGALITFGSSRWGKQRAEWGDPKQPPAKWGVPETLGLKVGATVMILANARREGIPPQPYKYVNGDLGTIVDCDVDAFQAHVQLQRSGLIEKVDYVTRTVKVPCDAARRKELREQGEEDKIDGKMEIIGAITYMPLRLAFASTVHKSQGLSMDCVQININDHFFKSPGMIYVALSRARTAEGIRLVGRPAGFIERCATDPKLRAWL